MSAHRRALVALDLGNSTQPLLDAARAMLDDGGEVLAAHVIEPIYDLFGAAPGIATAITTLDSEALRLAETAFANACEAGNIPPERRYLMRGFPVPQLLTLAREEKADLLVVGSHRQRGLRSLLGSTSNALLNQAPCDVLVVRVTDEQK